jgi:hypothetical protein
MRRDLADGRRRLPQAAQPNLTLSGPAMRSIIHPYSTCGRRAALSCRTVMMRVGIKFQRLII